MNLEVKPFTSVGPVSFGESRTSVRKKLGAFVSFHKAGSEIPTDAYDDLGLHLFYDEEDGLELLEVFEPAGLVVEGIQLLGRPFEAVAKELADLGLSGKPTDIGFQYDDIGVSFILSDIEIEGVGVARRGYFDE